MAYMMIVRHPENIEVREDNSLSESAATIVVCIRETRGVDVFLREDGHRKCFDVFAP